MENIGFIIRTILNVVDLSFPNRKLNQQSLDVKRAFIVAIMDYCHRIIRLNANKDVNIINETIIPNVSNDQSK